MGIQASCPISTARDDSLAAMGKGYRIDEAAVSFEGEDFVTAGRVPDLGRLIMTGGD